jgi:valyl-tRNA synthetase
MGYGREENTILRAPWPKPWTADRLQAWGITDEVVAYVDAKHELIRAGRQLRADYSIVPSQKVDFILKPSSADGAGRLRADEAPLRSLLRAGTITIDPGFTPPKAVPGAVSGLGSLYMPLEGLIDVAAERTRLNGQIEKLAEELDRVRRKLDNPDFVNKAKPEVVEQQRARRQESEEKLAKLRKLLEALGG